MPEKDASEGRNQLIPLAILAAGSLIAAALVVPNLLGLQTPESAGTEVVAEVDGESVLRSELEVEAAAQLEQVDLKLQQCQTDAESQRHTVLNSSVERVVRRRLLDIEATNRGVEAEEVQNGVRDSVGSVSQEDVDAWWEQNKNRVNRPKEQVEDQIRQLLLQQRYRDAENAFFNGLKDRYEVEYLLQPYRVEVASEGYPSIGPEDAPVTIVEFSDFECPYCQRVLPTLDMVKNTYNERVRLVFRQFPLSIHANAPKAAEASLCANDQGKFWEMHDLMFQEQKKLAIADLKEKFSRLDSDDDAFVECLDSGKYSAEVQKDLREGTVAGVSGTPAMFVNGRPISGAVPFQQIATVINEELARTQ